MLNKLWCILVIKKYRITHSNRIRYMAKIHRLNLNYQNKLLYYRIITTKTDRYILELDLLVIGE